MASIENNAITMIAKNLQLLELAIECGTLKLSTHQKKRLYKSGSKLAMLIEDYALQKLANQKE